MKLFLAATPRGAGICTVAELVEAVRPHVQSIDILDRGVLDDIAARLSKGETITDRRIAKGTPAERGRDGRVVLLVKPFTGKGEVEIDGKGLAHFNRLHLFDNIAAGQVVARVYPPHAGVAGCDAAGKAVTAPPGKPVKCGIDATLKLQPAESYEEVVALAPGYLVQDDTRLRISSILEIKGDLDLGYGNLSFVGAVVIAGEVRPDLTVTAQGNIDVRGGVQGAMLVSKAGNVTVNGFLHGAGRGEIVSAGSFTGRLLQDVSIEVGEDIFVSKEARECRLRAQRAIRMPEGDLIGGMAYFVRGIDVRTIGNEQGVTTALYPSSSVEMSSDFGRLEVELENHEKAIELLKLHLGPLAYEPERLSRTKEPYRAKMEKLLEKYRAVRHSRARLAVKRAELLQTGIVAERVVITVRKALFPGTVINGKENRFAPNDAIFGPISIVYVPATDVFEVQPVQDLEPNPEQEKKG